MDKNLEKYTNMGYTEIIEGEVDHVMFKQFNNGNTWLVAFKNNDNGVSCIYLTKAQIDELKEKLR